MEANAKREPALLEIKANIDKECHERYYWFCIAKSPLTWVMWLIPLSFAAHAVFTSNQRQLVVSAVFLLLMFLFFPGPRRAYQRLPKRITEDGLVFTFYQDDFQVTHTTRLSAGIATVRYGYLKSARETKRTFYLQTVDRNRGMYALDKKCFTPEQIEAFRSLLAQKFGKKFKGRKK